MASANRLRVERIISQLNTRDPDIADLCHPEIEWRWPATTPGAPLFRGHAVKDAEKARRRFLAGDRPG